MILSCTHIRNAWCFLHFSYRIQLSDSFFVQPGAVVAGDQKEGVGSFLNQRKARLQEALESHPQIAIIFTSGDIAQLVRAQHS